jgi:hypothetical protein
MLNDLQFNRLGGYLKNEAIFPSGFSFTWFLHQLYKMGLFGAKTPRFLYIACAICV